MRTGAAAALLLLLPVPATRAETPAAPDWAMLAECSAVFRAVSRADGYAGADPASLAQSAAVAQAFHARAITLAGESGQPEPEQDVASIMGYLDERWDKRIGAITSTASNLDWISYCTELGHAYGVLPLPG